MVLSSVEDTRTVNYRYNRQNIFAYDVVALKDLDAGQFINNVEPKIDSNKEILGHDLVLYSLLPIIDSKNIDNHIDRVVNNLIKLKNLTLSLKSYLLVLNG